MIEITVYGDTPSKKNSRIFNTRGGFPVSLPGSKYQAWHKSAMDNATIIRGDKSLFPFQKTSEIIIKVFSSTRRAADMTNRAESVMDLLVDMGVLEDDNWNICPIINLRYGGCDKTNPRAEIEIHP